MSHGVKTLEDLRQRCSIDDLTGCWNWGLAMSYGRGKNKLPATYISPGVMGDKGKCMPAPRASWLLAGGSIPEGGAVWRHKCWNEQCINPGHLKAGTRAQMGAAITKSGHLQGDLTRSIINKRNRSGIANDATPELVRQVETLFAEGLNGRQIAARIGRSPALVCRIGRGEHRLSAGRQLLARGASVFAWGGA